MERCGHTAGCEACARRGGSHTHACGIRLEECLIRQGQTCARADAQALGEALLPDSDVLEETRSRNCVSRVQHGQSGAQASSASKREIESKEIGDMGAFDMDVGGESPEVSVPKKSRIPSLENW